MGMEVLARLMRGLDCSEMHCVVPCYRDTELQMSYREGSLTTGQVPNTYTSLFLIKRESALVLCMEEASDTFRGMFEK
jgi:hypothetical protein